MIITCPSCSTRYTVDPAAFETGGRPVRCSACGYHWTQEPEPPAMLPTTAGGVERTARPEAPPPPDRDTFAFERQDPSPPLSAAELGAAPADRPAAPDAPEPEMEAEATRQDDGFGQAVLSSAGVDEPLIPDADESDVRAGAPDPEPVLKREAMPAAPTPEAIPPGDLSPDETPARRRWLVAAAAAAVAVVLVLVLLVVARGAVVSAFPAAAGLYTGIGLGGEEAVGAGLQIQDVTSVREGEGADEALVVEGVIVNATGQSHGTPLIRVALLDADDREMHAVTVPPDGNTLAPGATVRFRAHLPSPLETARRIQIRFAPRSESS